MHNYPRATALASKRAPNGHCAAVCPLHRPWRCSSYPTSCYCSLPRLPLQRYLVACGIDVKSPSSVPRVPPRCDATVGRVGNTAQLTRRPRRQENHITAAPTTARPPHDDRLQTPDCTHSWTFQRRGHGATRSSTSTRNTRHFRTMYGLVAVPLSSPQTARQDCWRDKPAIVGIIITGLAVLCALLEPQLVRVRSCGAPCAACSLGANRFCIAPQYFISGARSSLHHHQNTPISPRGKERWWHPFAWCVRVLGATKGTTHHARCCRHDKPRCNPAVQSVQRASLRGVWLRAASRGACARLCENAVSVSMQTNARNAQKGTAKSTALPCGVMFVEVEQYLLRRAVVRERDPPAVKHLVALRGACLPFFSPASNINAWPAVNSMAMSSTSPPTNRLSKHPVRRDCAHLPGIRQAA
ncbi:hypothetical protein IWX90DRAFT_411131 [Phyllosticta citrichinensis]|uniref:Uncharacterized protein n=1 Tax=Phyllosticta citrichinensis TaxID=1130410 RepID=A0ABR1Y7D8_9PEZI